MKKTLIEHIEDFNKIHNNKYNYSKVNIFTWKGYLKKIPIICPEHGLFYQTPSDHKRPNGCKNCGIKKGSKKRIISFDNLQKEFNKIHKNKYDYSKVKYKNISTKIDIICPEHGVFSQLPMSHKLGYGCNKCRKYTISKEKIIKHIEEFNKIHKNKYDYSKVKYKNSNTKIDIICPEHGVFRKTPNAHKSGQGCPNCKESKGETIIRHYLEENNISFKQEYKLSNNQRFDFYLEEYNTIIEFDGIQHFQPVDFFGGKEGFIQTKERDIYKNNYCKDNNIKLIRISYKDIKKINNILEKELY